MGAILTPNLQKYTNMPISLYYALTTIAAYLTPRMAIVALIIAVTLTALIYGYNALKKQY